MRGDPEGRSTTTAASRRARVDKPRSRRHRSCGCRRTETRGDDARRSAHSPSTVHSRPRSGRSEATRFPGIRTLLRPMQGTRRGRRSGGGRWLRVRSGAGWSWLGERACRGLGGDKRVRSSASKRSYLGVRGAMTHHRDEAHQQSQVSKRADLLADNASLSASPTHAPSTRGASLSGFRPLPRAEHL